MNNQPILTSNIYLTLPWCWNEVSRFSLDSCSFVSYFSNASCRFPVYPTDANLGQSMERLIIAGRVQGAINHVGASWSDWARAYEDLTRVCNLDRDEAAQVPDGADPQSYMADCVYYAHIFISKALRFVSCVEDSVKIIGRLHKSSGGRCSEGIWAEAAYKYAYLPSSILLKALRNSSEHGYGYISAVNYSPSDRTFGLAINLESGIVSDRNSISLFKKSVVTEEGQTMLDWLESFCRERSESGLPPLLSFSYFYREICLYLAAEGLAFIEASLSPAHAFTQEAFAAAGVIPQDRSYGLYVETDHRKNRCAKGPLTWFYSDRIYPLFTAQQLDGYCKALGDLFASVVGRFLGGSAV